MADIVYILCAITSLACSLLLLRGYRRTRTRLLFWSGLCFLGLALNNILLFLDLSVFTSVDLSIIRSLPAVIGLGLLIFGLVWDSK